MSKHQAPGKAPWYRRAYHKIDNVVRRLLVIVPVTLVLFLVVGWLFGLFGPATPSASRWFPVLSLVGLIGILMSGAFAASRAHVGDPYEVRFRIAGERLLHGVIWIGSGVVLEYLLLNRMRPIVLEYFRQTSFWYPVALALVPAVLLSLFYVSGSISIAGGLFELHRALFDVNGGPFPTGRPGADGE